MDTMTYASVAALPETVAKSSRRLLVPEVELTPLDLSYLGKSIRAEISRLREQLTELKDEVRRLAGLLKYLGKSRSPSENSDREKIDAELAFQRTLDRLDREPQSALGATAVLIPLASFSEAVPGCLPGYKWSGRRPILIGLKTTLALQAS